MMRSLIAAVCLLALAGCGGKAAAKPTPSPTPSTATITQYASAMNGPLHDFKKEWDTYEQQCVIEQNKFVCAVQPLTINTSALVVQLTLESANKPGAQTYIGPPPAELVRLVQSTLDDATAVLADTADNDHLADSMHFDCNALSMDVDAWGPYLS